MYTKEEVENLLQAQLIKTETQCYNNFQAKCYEELSLIRIPPKKELNKYGKEEDVE